MRTIDADALEKTMYATADLSCADSIHIDVIADIIGNAPTVDAVPIRHGRWIYHIDDLFPAESTQECDQCHEEQPLTCGDNYCPNCGAKMHWKDGDLT